MGRGHARAQGVDVDAELPDDAFAKALAEEFRQRNRTTTDAS